MTPQFILRASLCRKPHCASEPNWKRTAESEIENMNYANGYSEPGYTDPAKCVLFANWNYFPTKIADVLESAGYAIEWSDEWDTCENCHKAVRTAPDRYGWRPSFVLMNDCEIICNACLLENDSWTREYLESLEDNPNTALNLSRCDPAKYGYKQVEAGFENGWHPGQNDDPKAIADKLRASGVNTPLLFKVDDTGQFDIRFSVWTRDEETKETDETEAK